jgi:copper chaperone
MSEFIALKIDGMGCQGCVSAVDKAVRSVAPEAKIDISLTDGEVRVAGASAQREAIIHAITKAGYDVLTR